MPPLRITLIGFSGSGKSTVAALVAERLGWQAVDSDDVIEAEAGRDVRQIFANEGEASFRAHEAAVLEKLRDRERIVVAAGGGAGLDLASRRAIVEAGLVVCLDASVETVVDRLASATTADRPLLADLDSAARIRRLKAQRAAVYALADASINTDWLTPAEVAAEVVRFYDLHGERAFNRPGRVGALTETPSGLPPIGDAPGATAFIRTAGGDYPAYVAWGALERLGELTKRATGARRAFVISDAKVLSLWGEAAVASLREHGLEVATLALPPGEASKSLDGASRAYDWLASQRAERRDAIVALGGGMVGDFAGFVAGTYLRGMPVVQAPTSLLAMVDAAIGGKTAVNHAGAKNIVGLFYQPKAVVADVAALGTLPRRELVEGLAEVVKHALIPATRPSSTSSKSASTTSSPSSRRSRPTSSPATSRSRAPSSARTSARRAACASCSNYGHTPRPRLRGGRRL